MTEIFFHFEFNNVDKHLKVAVSAVKKSGEMLAREYGKFDRGTVILKARHEIVTKCDLLSEEMIVNEIRRNFPSSGIISEEKGEIKSYDRYTWILDPIDGTTNFSMHNPIWCISLALAEAGEIILGVIYAPVLDEMYIGTKNRAAELNGKKITVSRLKEGKVINTYGSSREIKDIKRAIAYYRKQKLAVFDCRQFGSAALELAYLACGRIESFVSFGTHDWDVAAGTLIAREAGAKITDFSGRPWRLGYPDIAASNGLVHQQILKVINSGK